MRLIRGFGLFLFIGLIISACFNPPEYPVQPQIEFESIVYKEVGTGFDGNFDSLILKINFKDGDGDLGLGESDTRSPYNNKYYLVYFADFSLDSLSANPYNISSWTAGTEAQKGFAYQFQSRFWASTADKNRETPSELSNLWIEFFPLNYVARRTIPEFQNIETFIKPYNCINWEVYMENDLVKDTLFFNLNPDHYNITIDFFIKNGDGTYTEFDWVKEFNYPGCGGTFDGRFPILFKDEKGSPLEGTIRYGMGSTGFKSLFSIKAIKLRIQIKDRALHKSNVIETPDFTL